VRPWTENHVQRKRRARMAAIDALSPTLRALVHDYGYTVVRAYLDCGVTSPRRIEHLVETTLNEMSATRGSYSAQGVRSARED
jgi:hypothetical protein